MKMNPERSEELVEGKAVISSSIDHKAPLPAVGEACPALCVGGWGEGFFQ